MKLERRYHVSHDPIKSIIATTGSYASPEQIADFTSAYTLGAMGAYEIAKKVDDHARQNNWRRPDRRPDMQHLVRNLPEAIRLFSEDDTDPPEGYKAIHTIPPDYGLLDLVAQAPNLTWDGQTEDYIFKTYKAAEIAIDAHLSAYEAQQEGMPSDFFMDIARKGICDLLGIRDPSLPPPEEKPHTVDEVVEKLGLEKAGPTLRAVIERRNREIEEKKQTKESDDRQRSY